MQDIIRYDIIPRAPELWLGVSRGCRTAALDAIGDITMVVPYSQQFWRIIGLLYANGRRAAIAAFSARGYNADTIDDWLDWLFDVSWINESDYKLAKVGKYCRFIEYLDSATRDKMLEYVIAWMQMIDGIPIYRRLPRELIIGNPDIYEDVECMFNDEYYMREPWTDGDTECVRFAVEYFPDIVARYVAVCVGAGAPPNDRRECVHAVIDLAVGVLDEDIMAALRARYPRA